MEGHASWIRYTFGWGRILIAEAAQIEYTEAYYLH
jgi:hypothetical protein